MKAYIVDAAIKLFGYYLFNKKDAQRILELEQQLYEANSLIKDTAWLTQPNKVGSSLAHMGSVIESTHHYNRKYCERHGINYEEL